MELLPCPFCGAGTTRVVMNGQTWTGTKYSDPISVSVVHHCDPIEGQPSRQIERIGRDAESAIAAWNRRANPASAPDGFKHDIGADRFTVVQGSYWWHVRAGEGTQNIGKFHTKRAAEEMALTLLTAFRDGAFMQYQAMLIAAPTTPVSEDRKDATLKFAVREVLKWVQGDFPTEGYLRDNDESRKAIAKLKQAMQEDKP